MTRVAVTGLGVVCSLGRGVREVWAALVEGRRGFGPVTLFSPGSASSAPVAQVAGFEAARRARGSRLDRLIRAAAGEAVEEAGVTGSAGLSGFGVSLGNCNGGMLEAESWYEAETAAARAAGGSRRPRPISAAPALSLPPSSSTDALAAHLGARGPRLTNTTACSSSAAAIAAAADMIRDGEAEGMVAGGGDPLCRLTYAGFASLRLMDPAGCRPFDGNRKGLTLGEGAGILILEAWDRARERDARPLAEVLAHGASCDAHHMTSCHPEGRGMRSAMAEAMARSRVQPGDVGYVNAHGTATPVNDAAEGKAIEGVFGRARPAVSSTKSMHGHLLGGSGALEAVTTILALVHGALPPTAGLVAPDGEADLDLVAGAARSATVRRAASNSFGFGGGNVVLLFGSAMERT